MTTLLNRQPPGVVLALAFLPLTAACSRVADQVEPRPLVGCHFFVQDDVARQLNLPWGVRLLDQPLEGFPAMQQIEGVRRATTLTGYDERGFPFGYWVRTAEDSIAIGSPGGGALFLALEIVDGTFTGYARPVGDAVPLGAEFQRTTRHPVQLTWARCPED